MFTFLMKIFIRDFLETFFKLIFRVIIWGYFCKPAKINVWTAFLSKLELFVKIIALDPANLPLKIKTTLPFLKHVFIFIKKKNCVSQNQILSFVKIKKKN
mmetsp:Transcript_37416/g.95616  ORF Transcript_37416/g.95616 Transcript_37416/m.95616 type:complete len:100 (+) Transcript_37416:986-1285(+)